MEEEEEGDFDLVCDRVMPTNGYNNYQTTTY